MWTRRIRTVSGTKRVANRIVPRVGRVLGSRIPKPELATAQAPDAVLDWCTDALRRRGRAALSTYASSAVALARVACDRGTSLEGLAMRIGGEPITEAKTRAVTASGAFVVNGYAFAQIGRSGTSCPHSASDDLHVLEHHVAVVPRRRERPDGVTVEALCWTSLDPATPSVFINVENDDYGHLRRDPDSCPCELGAMGMRTRVRGVRGISKVVTAGITLPGERLEHLAEVLLPARFGGGPMSYQFADTEHEGMGGLLVRVDPAVGDVDHDAVIEVIVDELRRDDLGVLALEVWASGRRIDVVRAGPIPSPSGKVLAYEPLR